MIIAPNNNSTTLDGSAFLLKFIYALVRLSSVVCRLSSVVCRLSSVVCRLSSVVCRLSSVICRLSSVVCRLSSVVCRLSSVVCRLSSVVCRLSSVVCLFRSLSIPYGAMPQTLRQQNFNVAIGFQYQLVGALESFVFSVQFSCKTLTRTNFPLQMGLSGCKWSGWNFSKLEV